MNQKKRRNDVRIYYPTFDSNVRSYWLTAMDQLKDYAKCAILAKLESDSKLSTMYREMAECEAEKALNLAAWLDENECADKSAMTSTLLDQLKDMLK